MTEPIFWLGISLLLVAVSLTAVLIAAVPAFRELARAARSAEKLFDTLSRDLPPTLESIRKTGLEITDLTEDVSEGVQRAGRVVQQVDQSVVGIAQQAKQAQSTTRSVWIGVKAAWATFNRPSPRRRPPERFSGKIRRPFDPALNPPSDDRERWADEAQQQGAEPAQSFDERELTSRGAIHEQAAETTYHTHDRAEAELDHRSGQPSEHPADQPRDSLTAPLENRGDRQA